MMAIRLIGFTPEDLDTTIIRKYEPSNFTTPVDSSIRFWSVSPIDTLYYDYFDSEGFDFSKNYEVLFPGISRTYRISELKIRREHCNCGQKDGKRVDGYTLDGQKSDDDIIYLRKYRTANVNK
jgi:hypothetical protein